MRPKLIFRDISSDGFDQQDKLRLEKLVRCHGFVDHGTFAQPFCNAAKTGETRMPYVQKIKNSRYN